MQANLSMHALLLALNEIYVVSQNNFNLKFNSQFPLSSNTNNYS